MGRGVTRVTRALAVALLVMAGTAQAQSPITIEDVRIPEQTGGPWTFNTPGVRVQIPGPPAANVTVNWTVTSGSATAGSDFLVASGTLTFQALIDSTKYIDLIQIVGDSVDEWSPTLQQDEVFFVDLSSPSANATIAKGRGTVTLIDDDRFRPGVQFLSAVSGGNISIGMNKLQWRIPGAQTPVTDVTVAWKVGPSCTFPVAPTDITGGGNASLGSVPGAGRVQTWTHTPGPAPNTTYCYSVFAIYAGVPVTGPEVAKIKTKTFDATGTIAWTYASGATSVVPPTIGPDAIYTTDNAGVVHAMQRGAAGGAWPLAWNPVALGAPTQNRSAVVPASGGWRLFLGTDGGGVHALDGQSGSIVWSRSATFGSALPNVGGAQAQPAALLKAYGGNNDMILVGTNNGGSNAFVALNPANGLTQGPAYTHAQMGSSFGMPVVDYPGNRVFFLTNASSATLYGLDLGPLGTPTLTLAVVAGGNPRAFTGSNGSAVVRNNRLVFGDGTGQVFGVDLVGGTSYNAPTGDGEVKGFLWPDRRNTNLYFSTTSKVNGIRDNGGSFATLPWSPITNATDPSITSPSMVLQKPGTDFLYVGNNQGQLVQIDISSGTPVITPLTLEATGQIGSPSLDGTHNLVVVGSSTGTIHAVRVPF